MRTIVAPSSTATSKSSVMPIDSAAPNPGCRSRSRSESLRSATKVGRAASGGLSERLSRAIVTALEVLRVVTTGSANLATLAGRIPLLPQEQRAVRVRHKEQWEGDPVLRRAIADAEARLGGAGRVLVRPSGTEPALRVMVEGPDAAVVGELATSLAALAEQRLH